MALCDALARLSSLAWLCERHAQVIVIHALNMARVSHITLVDMRPRFRSSLITILDTLNLAIQGAEAFA